MAMLHFLVMGFEFRPGRSERRILAIEHNVVFRIVYPVEASAKIKHFGLLIFSSRGKYLTFPKNKNLDSYRRNFNLQLTTLIGGVLLMVVKFAAWWITNSNSILTDALESIINVVGGAFGLFSLYVANLPRDRNHPYGHGKIEFISAGFEGGLIFIAGLTIIIKSVYNLLYPQQLEQLGLGILIVLVSGLVNFFMGLALTRRGQRINSLIMEASGKHLKSDAYSSAGLLVGLGVIFLTGISWLDGVVAIGFGLVILQRHPDWIDIHYFRIIRYGATLHIDCHLTLPWYYEVRQGHARVKELEQTIAQHSDQPIELFIHADPCDPPKACRICHKNDCPVREAPFESAIDWSLEKLLHNDKHYR